MSIPVTIAETDIPVVTPPSQGPSGSRAPINVMEKISIPGWINDLESYRRWAYSGAYPETGWVSFLDNEIWVDTSMEEFWTHNQVKTAYYTAILVLLQKALLGRFEGPAVAAKPH